MCIRDSQFIRLNGNHTIQLYAHASGDEFWHWMLLSPMLIPAITLKIPAEGLTSVDLHVNKKQKNVLKRENNCEHYENPGDFTACAKKAIEEGILKEATCVTHMSRPIIPNAVLPGERIRYSIFGKVI